MPQFLGTNILLYSISRNDQEAPKRIRAIELLDNQTNCLSIEVLQEFYVHATRASRPDPIPHQLASALINTWSRFRVQDMTMPVLQSALRIRDAHRISFWDSAVLAAALALGCDRIYTEDLNHGQMIEGLTIINPFR